MSLPKVIDNYSATIVGNFTASSTTITVSAAPTTITEGYLTIFDLNGDQLEKIKFTGVSGNDLTGCIRGLSFTEASDTPPGGLGQALQNGMEIKLADSISYYNPIVDVLNGDTAAPGVMKNPDTRTISDSRHLTDKEYVDGISAAGITSMLVSDNGGITVNINSGTYILNGTIEEYAGASAQSLTDDDTNYVQLVDGVLDINITGFSNDAIPLAEVVCASGDITSLLDKRPFYTGVDIKANSGLGRDATGVYIDLATDPGLEFSGGKLQAKLKTSGGLSKDSDGIFSNPSYSFIAGETINGATLPVPVYQNTSDNKIYSCKADDTTKINFIGFAITNSTNGNNIIIQYTGIVGGFSGLLEGNYYYIQDTIGTIGINPGTITVKVGIAISETELLIIKNPKKASGVISNLVVTAAGNNDVTVDLGFRPKIIKLNYFIQGHDESIQTGDYQSEKGIAVWEGTNIKYKNIQWQITVSIDNYVPTSSSNDLTFPNNTSEVSNPTVGVATGTSGHVKITLSINSVTNTGFVIRRLTETTSATNNARAKISYEAYE